MRYLTFRARFFNVFPTTSYIFTSDTCVFSCYYWLHPRGRVMRVIVSAYNILKNIEQVFIREITPHSLFQCFVEALDDGGFNVRIARYPKKRMSFSLRNFYIVRQIFCPCPFASIWVLRFSLICAGKFLSRKLLVLSRSDSTQTYLFSTSIITKIGIIHCTLQLSL